MARPVSNKAATTGVVKQWKTRSHTCSIIKGKKDYRWKIVSRNGKTISSDRGFNQVKGAMKNLQSNIKAFVALDAVINVLKK